MRFGARISADLLEGSGGREGGVASNSVSRIARSSGDQEGAALAAMMLTAAAPSQVPLP